MRVFLVSILAATAVLLLSGYAAAPDPPAAPPEARAPAGVTTFPRARKIKVPSAFRAEVYARGLTHPTAMAFGPNGLLYVTEDTGLVVVARPNSTRPRVFARNFPTPLGLAWKDDLLFVSAQGRIERMRLQSAKPVGRRRIVTGLPFDRHQQNNIVVRAGRLYFGSGSTCDVCTESDRRSATILSIRPDGSGLRVVARGLRNPYGVAVNPATGKLFASVNGQDNISSTEPAEMLVRIESGAKYGWPTCRPSWSRKRMVGSCAGVTRPIAYLEPHSAAGSIAFPEGTVFPSGFRSGVFVALWGQYYSTRWGRKVKFVSLPSRRVRQFASGFAHPLALTFDAEGALLVADWGRGTIYRIQARGKP